MFDGEIDRQTDGGSLGRMHGMGERERDGGIVGRADRQQQQEQLARIEEAMMPNTFSSYYIDRRLNREGESELGEVDRLVLKGKSVYYFFRPSVK